MSSCRLFAIAIIAAIILDWELQQSRSSQKMDLEQADSEFSFLRITENVLVILIEEATQNPDQSESELG